MKQIMQQLINVIDLVDSYVKLVFSKRQADEQD